ncbi:MAG: ROK family protein [Lactobacillales bacterium]|jgi:predicted NBD/HSP70 family sugar kinase|nr:ROK family protein [Lactobacillales bacterium]
MSEIGLLDVGGTSIKYGVWKNEELIDKGTVDTPKTLEEYYKVLTQIIDEMKKNHQIIGVGMSTPGSVDKETGIIGGASAVPYIHDFPIKIELEKQFDLPVSFENDANCAAMAEVRFGAGKDLKNVLFIIIGTGIGGSVIVDGKVQHGKHLFGGEFGFMLMDDKNSFSSLGTAVNMARRYTKRKNDGMEYTGKQVFELADKGDSLALEESEIFYYNLAKGIYNLQYAFDPEKIILGGGVSQAEFLISNVNKRLQAILDQVKIAPFMPEIVACEFKNDANLIGAAADFISEHSEEVLV